MSGTPPRFVWLISDQEKNDRVVRAYVSAVVRRRFADPFPTVRHVFVLKSSFRAKSVGVVWRQLERNLKEYGGRTSDPVLLFRDADVDAHLYQTAADDVLELARALTAHTPHVFGLAFNPMSEGALLLFDAAVERLRTSAPEAKRFERLVRDRRQGVPISPEHLKTALQLAAKKRDIDKDMEALLFADWPACDHEAFVAVTDRIVQTLVAAGLTMRSES